MSTATDPLRRDPDHLCARLPQAAIRVFAIDDHPLCLRGLAVMLASDGHCHWSGEAADLPQALARAPALCPDLIVLAHRPPGFDGVAAIEALRPHCRPARFLLLTDPLQAHALRRAFDAGVGGLLHWSVTTADLLLAVRAVHSGQRYLGAQVAAAMDEGPGEARPPHELTRRETTLLMLMAQGLENRAIASEMNIAVPTVKFHLTNIMGKLQAPNRTAAVLVALRLGLIALNAAQQPGDKVATTVGR